LRISVGLSAAEIAEALGMTEGAVRVAQHRALTRLRGMVDDVRVQWHRRSGPTCGNAGSTRVRQGVSKLTHMPRKKPRCSAHASTRRASFDPSATTKKLAERSPYAVASGTMSDTAAPTERRLNKYSAPVGSALAAAFANC
jgi:hypothetical protein